jgi:hypothetical protein
VRFGYQLAHGTAQELRNFSPVPLNDENSRAKFQNVCGDSSAGSAPSGRSPVSEVRDEPTCEIAVDWRLTTQPNSDEQGDTQLKSRSPEVLTPQHSDDLGATQHNSAKLVQFGLLICGLWVRFPPGSPLIPKDLAHRPPADSLRLRSAGCGFILTRSPLIQNDLATSTTPKIHRDLTPPRVTSAVVVRLAKSQTTLTLQRNTRVTWLRADVLSGFFGARTTRHADREVCSSPTFSARSRRARNWSADWRRRQGGAG